LVLAVWRGAAILYDTKAMARVLLVDDDCALLDVISLAVTDAGHEVTAATDGAEALLMVLAAPRPDIVISDVNMPKTDGFAFCRRVRELGNSVPIILLTSRAGEIDEALGLELGADDYVVKPFSTRVLLARIGALLRRQAKRAGSETAPVVRAGDLTLDVERLEASYAGVPITLTLSEFRLLEGIARKPGIVLSRDRLLEIVRGDDSVVDDRIIDTYVRRLRRKLEATAPGFAQIETVIGAGYRWRAP
jgi:DNA-binding response OmpR family regulator